MDDAELDDWFGQEKDRLEDRFYAEKDTTKAKEQFDRDYRKLLAAYQRKQEDIYAHQRRHAALQKPIRRWKEAWHLRVAMARGWFEERKLAVRKWLFDRKIKRILQDRSNYP